jgi:hypothetical protein
LTGQLGCCCLWTCRIETFIGTIVVFAVLKMSVAKALLVADELSNTHVHANGSLLLMGVFDGLHMRHDIVSQCVQHYDMSAARNDPSSLSTHPLIDVCSWKTVVDHQ